MLLMLRVILTIFDEFFFGTPCIYALSAGGTREKKSRNRRETSQGLYRSFHETSETGPYMAIVADFQRFKYSIIANIL